jgi:succinate dehydrogenase/fumarate reductase cytochrome b subunit
MRSRGRLATIASCALFAYLLVWMIELASLQVSDSTFGRFQDWSASLAGRILAGAVWTAAVYHGLEGLRASFRAQPQPVDPEGAVPADGAFGAGVLAFLTWALILPGWVLVLRPWIEDLLR